MKIVAWAAAAAVAGFVVFQISTGKLDSKDGKFLGLVQENPASFGVDDILKGATILGGAWLAGMIVHRIGGPATVVKGPV